MKPALKPCDRYCWRQLPLAQRTGSNIFADLFRPQSFHSQQIATLLESPYPLPPDSLPEQAELMARYSICAGSPRVVEGEPQLWTPALGQILPLLRQMDAHKLQSLSQGIACGEKGVPDEDLPFIGGWLGWLGYDFAWEIERLPWLKEDGLPFPVAFWYEPAEFAVLDHQTQQLWLAAETTAALDGMVGRLLSAPAKSVSDPVATNATSSDQKPLHSEISSIYIDKVLDRSNEKEAPIDKAYRADTVSQSLRFETPQADFEAAVQQAKEHIRAGDVFQVNHSLRFQAQTRVPSWEVYQKLHRINPSPFASYWHTPWGSVVSCSPERLVHLRDGVAQTRPIAGTRPRGKTMAGDGAIAQELTQDPKERAEHIMLVDLERNDLGRVCEWGSVQVNELLTIERYSHVMHLVSNVIGQLHPDNLSADLIAALFPGGTITGCPKVRCMEIIEALEPVRRSLFYGSCGYFDRRGRLDLNILIRTLLMSPNSKPEPDSQSPVQTVWGQVGAGIVADSEPTKEWRESLQKAQAQLLALGL
ncbi:MAG: chorismate-binding protein [Cyanobacteria bacterium P01_F01_bin.53]